MPIYFLFVALCNRKLAVKMYTSDLINPSKYCWQCWYRSHWSIHCHWCSAQKDWEIWRFVTVVLLFQWPISIRYLACCITH